MGVGLVFLSICRNSVEVLQLLHLCQLCQHRDGAQMMRLAASSLPAGGVGVILTRNSNTDFPPLVVSDIDLMGWGTAALFCVWLLLSLHTQQQQQDSIASNTSAELEFREIVGYLEFNIFTYMSFL